MTFLKTYYPSKGSLFCAERVNATSRQVTSKCIKMGLRVTTERKSQAQRLTSTRDRPDLCNVRACDLINVSTPESAYVLGFIWADGYLIDSFNNRNKIVTEISSRDAFDIIPLFQTTGKWTIANRSRKNRQPQTLITTSNKELYQHLLQCNYHAKSKVTADTILDTIPESLRSAWFHGYFDGDGCFYTRPSNCIYQTTITGPIEQDWNFVERIYDSLGVKYSISRTSKPGSSCSRVRTSQKQSFLSIGRYMYSSGLTGLTRKRNIFNGIMIP